ncbi:hypothetical protein ILUMI_15514, partial [Ignelater luminosus]
MLSWYANYTGFDYMLAELDYIIYFPKYDVYGKMENCGGLTSKKTAIFYNDMTSTLCKNYTLNVFHQLGHIWFEQLVQQRSAVLQNLDYKFAEMSRSGVSTKEKGEIKRLMKEWFYQQIRRFCDPGRCIPLQNHRCIASVVYCSRLQKPARLSVVRKDLTSGGTKTALATRKTLQDGKL